MFDYSANITDANRNGMFAFPFPLPSLVLLFHWIQLIHVQIPILTTTGAVVARIDRKLLSGKDIFFGQQTYAVEIQPHYDAALVAAMCICLDEKNNEA